MSPPANLFKNIYKNRQERGFLVAATQFPQSATELQQVTQCEAIQESSIQWLQRSSSRIGSEVAELRAIVMRILFHKVPALIKVIMTSFAYHNIVEHHTD
jgi:hypothetical protein